MSTATTRTRRTPGHDDLYWARDTAYERERAAYAAARAGVYDLFPGSRVPEPCVLTAEQRELVLRHQQAVKQLRALRDRVIELPA
jgi:hypothetical protein